MVYAEVQPIHIVVCGGAALIAVGLVARATQDVDIIALLRTNESEIEILEAKILPADVKRLVAEIGTELGIQERLAKLRCQSADRLWLPAGHDETTHQVLLRSMFDSIFYQPL
jgi:hypothetical protein